MKKFAVLVMLLTFGATVSPAFGQATRTWVSGVGDDVNPCSRTAPCKTWAGAISKTAIDGLINALDDGPFGALTITKSITIDGGGHLAATGAGGTNGMSINISDNVNDTRRRVILRNIDIDGNSPVTLGNNGVLINGDNPGLGRVAPSSVTLENVHIDDFNQSGLTLSPGFTSAAPLELLLDGVVVGENGNGVNLRPGASSTQVSALIRNSTIFGNKANGNADTGIGLAADGGVHAWLSGTTMFANDVGLRAFGTNGGTGAFDGFCNNSIGGNGDDTTKPTEHCPPVGTNTETVVQTVTVTQCTVPKLKGLTLAFAKKLLKAANCALGKVTKKNVRKRRQVGTILSQKTRAGTHKPKGTKVAVTVGKR